MVALEAAGVGVAELDTIGHLLAGDARFLALHGIDAAALANGPDPATSTVQGLLNSAACTLAAADAKALSAAWDAVLSSLPGDDRQRPSVALDDGRRIVLAAIRTEGGGTVLTASEGEPVDREAAGARSRLIHDMNNLVGGALANLYLCLVDLPADHPVRERLETVNRSTIDLRGLVRQLGGSAGRSV